MPDDVIRKDTRPIIEDWLAAHPDCPFDDVERIWKECIGENGEQYKRSTVEHWVAWRKTQKP